MEILEMKTNGNNLETSCKKKKRTKYLIYKYLALFLVPRAGVEPARVAPLVFETSASTDSAIWASFRLQR